MTQSTASAAISWFDAGGLLHIRVYSSDGETITERCIDQGGSGWTTGEFSQPGQLVSAIVWVQPNEGAHLRVYCTAPDPTTFELTTTEWCNDPGTTGWTKGSYSPG